MNLSRQHFVIARNIGDPIGGGNALGTLGSIYIRLGQYPQAIDILEQRLAISRSIGDRF
ncbi:MAG: tetratricopeptide repeat protein [Leptolyngbyaceae cyanobacterium]